MFFYTVQVSYPISVDDLNKIQSKLSAWHSIPILAVSLEALEENSIPIAVKKTTRASATNITEFLLNSAKHFILFSTADKKNNFEYIAIFKNC
jgi:hypothetical protein